MKRILALFLALLTFCALLSACGAKETPDDENENEQSEEEDERMTPFSFSVMTYNTQNAGVSKGNEPSHDAKYKKLAGMIDQKKPDLIALQECAAADAANSIRKKLADKDNYSVVTGSSGAHTALIYNKTVFEKTASGCQQIGTKGDETGSAYDRYLNWVKLRHIESGTEFVVIPVHVDYVKEAYLAQLQKITDFLKEEQAGVSAILMGDFNARPDALKNSAIGTERYNSARELATVNNTKNTATFLGEGGGILDHVFYKSSVGFRGLKSQYYEVLTSDENNPSDHRPVYAEFSFGK